MDNYTRERAIIEVDSTLTGSKVVEALARLAKRYAYPRKITIDNGSEFVSKALDAWAYERGVQFDFIRPRKPIGECGDRKLQRSVSR